MARSVITLTCMMLLVCVWGCGKQEEPAKPADASKPGTMENVGKHVDDEVHKAETKVEETTEAVKETVKQVSDEVVSAYHTQLDKARNQFSSLKQTASQFKDERLQGTIDAIETKTDAAADKLTELKNATGDKIEPAKQELEKLMGEIKSLYEQGMAKLKELQAPAAPAVDVPSTDAPMNDALNKAPEMNK